MSFSRRRFLATASLTTGAFCFRPRFLFAAEESPVAIIRREAATAKIQISESARQHQRAHWFGRQYRCANWTRWEST